MAQSRASITGSGIARSVSDLDSALFDPILAQTQHSDRRALLALHDASARAYGSFAYLEIGSYLGGSLQALVRDPRCERIVSIDVRLAAAADKRTGTWAYDDNTTAHMRELLQGLPGADLSKLVTFDVDTAAMPIGALPTRPHYCFIDGEHTDEAVLRDARFCWAALGGRGVIAFHDDDIVRGGIERFLREAWREVSMAVALPGTIFAVELGDAGILRSPAVDRAVGSTWHSLAWRLASKAPTPAATLRVWSAMPPLDKAIADIRRRLARPKSQAGRSHQA